MLIIRQIFLSLILSLFAVANASLAAPITLDADHFTITYDGAQTGPYGQGFLSGSLDTVYFQPGAVSALSSGSPVSTPTSLQLDLTIDPGYAFAGLSFTERGTYYLLGDGTSGINTQIALVDPATLDSAVLNLASGSQFSAKQSLTLWELGGTLGPVGQGQTLQITLDGAVFSSASTGLAFIRNTYTGFQVLTTPAAVPEPTSLALLLAGMVGATLARRRAINRSAR